MNVHCYRGLINGPIACGRVASNGKALLYPEPNVVHHVYQSRRLMAVGMIIKYRLGERLKQTRTLIGSIGWGRPGLSVVHMRMVSF